MDSASDNNSTAQSTRTPGPRKNLKRAQGGRAASATSQGCKPNVDNRTAQRVRPASTAVDQASEPISTPNKAAFDQKAYAAPSFSASPAPSSLPVPRFFSKSVPAADPGITFTGVQHTPPPNTLSPYQQPTMLAGVPSSNPLDVLFNAQKSERAKHCQQPNNGPASSQTLSRSNTPERSKQPMFVMELDDESPAARRAGTMASAPAPAPPHWPSQNESAYRDSDHEADERMRATNDLKARLGLTPSQPPPPQPHTNFQGSPHNSQNLSNRPDAGTPSHANGLLYGNRNLSPMFQTARSASPNQHPSGRLPPINGSTFPPDRRQSPFSEIPHVGQTPPPRSQQQPLYGNPGPIPFPTQQLKQAQTPPQTLAQTPNQANLLFGPGPIGTTQQTPTGSRIPRDVQGMENDLRRILKLG